MQHKKVVANRKVRYESYHIASYSSANYFGLMHAPMLHGKFATQNQTDL